MTKELIVILDRRVTGRVRRDARSRLAFTYEEDWRADDNAYPLSISMPLALARHRHDKIDPFLWGLLPDNEIILTHWATKFHVSARNPFSLISAVGEDCAGAVQFVGPERLESILGQQLPAIEWLDEKDIAQRLRALREDHSAWRIPRDTGQFSLAGAQPKTALLLDDGRWGVPSGRVPTTHILKPPTGAFDGHAENEHFSLELGRALGLPVVDSRITHFENEIAIVVERYDRVRTPHGVRRVHQEDICQSLAIPPTKKYQNEGGPGISDIVELLRTYSGNPGEDIATFLDSVIYNWLIVGTDAHAKNYALLIGAGGRVRLAPLYDIASALPYDNIDQRRVKASMKIGGEYRFSNIGPRHWRKLAQELHIDADRLLQRIHGFIVAMPDNASEIEHRMSMEGLNHPLIPRLSRRLVRRAEACQRILG